MSWELRRFLGCFAEFDQIRLIIFKFCWIKFKLCWIRFKFCWIKFTLCWIRLKFCWIKFKFSLVILVIPKTTSHSNYITKTDKIKESIIKFEKIQFDFVLNLNKKKYLRQIYDTFFFWNWTKLYYSHAENSIFTNRWPRN